MSVHFFPKQFIKHCEGVFFYSQDVFWAFLKNSNQNHDFQRLQNVSHFSFHEHSSAVSACGSLYWTSESSLKLLKDFVSAKILQTFQ